MSVRVTSDEVVLIMENCTVDAEVIDTMIIAANALVNQVFASGTSLSAVMLKEIERYMTAHIIASTVQRTTAEEEVGDARVKWTGYWGQGLTSTPYGQMVLSLDTTGEMGKVGKKQASLKAITSFD